MSSIHQCIDLSSLSKTEIFTLWLCLHTNADQRAVQSQLQDVLSSEDKAQKIFDGWREDIFRQLQNKGMPDSGVKHSGEFADFLFCLLSKVSQIEQKFAQEIMLVHHLEQNPEINYQSENTLSSWFSDVLH